MDLGLVRLQPVVGLNDRSPDDFEIDVVTGTSGVRASAGSFAERTGFLREKIRGHLATTRGADRARALGRQYFRLFDKTAT